MWISRLGHSLRREVFNSNARTRRTRTRASSTRWLPRCGPPAVLPRGRVLANRQRRCFKARLHVGWDGGRRADVPKPKAQGLPKNRLETLIDGVFAIAMTILVLELRAPATPNPGGLAGGLVGLWSRFATFFISFIVLGVYWFANHQVFHFVLRVNRTLVWLNILFLMGIALIPFAASLMGTYPQDPIALSLYGAVLGLLAGLGYVIWWYLTGDRGLIEPGLDSELVREVRLWLAIGPVITPVAIAVSFVNTTVALLIYLALPVVFIFFNPVSRYLVRLRETEP